MLFVNRYLAEQFPSAGKVVGVDLSPYMLLTGRFMQQEDEVCYFSVSVSLLLATRNLKARHMHCCFLLLFVTIFFSLVHFHASGGGKMGYCCCASVVGFGCCYRRI